MTAHQLRYTGDRRVTFQTGNVGTVVKGDEFSVPENMLRRFMRRPDVEHAGDCPAPPCKCGEEPARQQEEAPAPEASEDASASQDGETGGGNPSGKRGRSGSPSGKNGTGGQ